MKPTATILLTGGFKFFPVLQKFRKRSGASVGFLYCNVRMDRGRYSQTRNSFETRVLAEATTALGKMWQGRRRAWDMQSIRGVTQLDAYCHY